jgi:hypothetical protein
MSGELAYMVWVVSCFMRQASQSWTGIRDIFQLVNHDFNSCTLLQQLGTELLQMFRVRLGFDTEFQHQV